MPTYTDNLERREYEITPEDENYVDELIETAASFRTFDKALIAFLQENNFLTKDVPGFLRSQFAEKHIPIPRSLPKWFSHGVRPDRKTAFQVCFALGLDLNGTQDFFRRVCLQRGIDCHDLQEAVYYFCLKNGFSWQEAQRIIAALPETAGEESEPLFTSAIVRELERIKTREQLISFLTENAPAFACNNVTASHYIAALWERITAERPGSVWKTYLHMVGLDQTTVSYDRSLKPILKNDSLLHPLAQDCFPDRQGLQLILSGRHVSYERVRKLLILLVFYCFWSRREMAKGGDAVRCETEVNRYLADSGYPILYAGNPYDWLFLFAMQDEYPLEIFRDFMRELAAQESER